MRTRIEQCVMVKYKDRYWAFGEASELTGYRPLLAPPAPSGLDERGAMSWFLKHQRLEVKGAVGNFLHIKEPTGSYLGVILDVERSNPASPKFDVIVKKVPGAEPDPLEDPCDRIFGVKRFASAGFSEQ